MDLTFKWVVYSTTERVREKTYDKHYGHGSEDGSVQGIAELSRATIDCGEEVKVMIRLQGANRQKTRFNGRPHLESLTDSRRGSYPNRP